MKKIFSCLALFLVFAGGCNRGDSGNPKEVLLKFFTALSTKNIQEAKKYVTADSEGMINMMQTGLQNTGNTQTSMFDPKNITLGDAQINGDEATVLVTERSTNETLNFILKKEEGSWKVAFDFSTLARMAKEKMKEQGINPENLDSAMSRIPKEDRDKVQKALDSISNKIDNVSPKELKKARDILDSLKKINH